MYEPEETIAIQQCSQCQEIIKPEAIFCTNCGYPERGTALQQSKFKGQTILKLRKEQNDQKQITSARVMLFWLAGILLVVGIFQYYGHNNKVALLSNVIVSLTYLGLAFWTKRKPFAALIAAVSLYALTLVMGVVIDPATLLQGVILKVIIIVLLIKGVYAAHSTRKS